jgi:hypothetical protein
MLSPVDHKSPLSYFSFPIESFGIHSFSFPTQLKSMASTNGQQGFCTLFNQLIAKIRNLFGWLFSKLTWSASSSPCPTLVNPSSVETNSTKSAGNVPQNIPSAVRTSFQQSTPIQQNVATNSTVPQSTPVDQLNFLIQKSSEIIDQHFRHNPYHPQFAADPANSFSFNNSLDPKSFATLVKIRYNGQEEAYMAEQSLPDTRAFFERKMTAFLIRASQSGLTSQNNSPLEIQTILLQKLSMRELAYRPLCSSVTFPNDHIQSYPDPTPFENYTERQGSFQLPRYNSYLHGILQHCTNSGADGVFLQGSTFRHQSSGSCADLVRQAIPLWNYPGISF